MTKKSMEDKRQNNLEANKQNEEIKKQEQEVAKKIEVILNESGFGLQPFIHPITEMGVIRALEGRVRLIKTPKNEEPKEN